MKSHQLHWTEKGGWNEVAGARVQKPSVIFVFGGRKVIEKDGAYEDIRKQYPEGPMVLCSTAGEIISDDVFDDTLALTAVKFEKTELAFAETELEVSDNGREAGERLAKELPTQGLVHVMVFADGQMVNGTALVEGLIGVLPKEVAVTGGLVGDGGRFEKTLIGLNGPAASGKIVLAGFYGNKISVGYGSLGGWDPFGPERTITKSKYNILYEIDGKPALSLYKEYLGDKAKELPSSGLLFPLSLRLKKGDAETEVVRTLLSVDEKTKSMTFAGDMPEGAPARLMKANFERLIDGASGAANMSASGIAGRKPELAILISCVGRKLVLKERTVEEIEAVRAAVGPQAAIAGFYSYGEICPTAPTEKQCQLHNQTMTITTFLER